MKHRILVVLVLLSAGPGWAVADDYTSAQSKIDQIQSDRLQPGTQVSLTLPELNAWVEHQLPSGVRSPKLRVEPAGLTTGSARIDIAKVFRAKGLDPGWLFGKLLEGERPVSVTARVTSSKGMATVDLRRVQIGDLDIDGKTLELLIQYVVQPVYPGATVGRPFDLGHNIDHFELASTAVRVVIGRGETTGNAQ